MKSLTIVVLLLLASCGSSKPSEAMGRAAVEKQAADRHIYSIKSFHKTDGSSGNLFGQEVYSMKFECQIQLLQDCIAPIPDGSASKGQVIKREGTLLFFKTENGWQSQQPHTSLTGCG